MKTRRIEVFVYGTLKRGERNHDRFCRGVLRVREASVHGWLYDLPFGFPALVVPEGSSLAAGTEDYAADTETQGSAVPGEAPSWENVVHGELLTFGDPVTWLPALDDLEGFRPSEESMYRRILIPTRVDGRMETAWAYTIERASGAYLPSGRWPARRTRR